MTEKAAIFEKAYKDYLGQVAALYAKPLADKKVRVKHGYLRS